MTGCWLYPEVCEGLHSSCYGHLGRGLIGVFGNCGMLAPSSLCCLAHDMSTCSNVLLPWCICSLKAHTHKAARTWIQTPLGNDLLFCVTAFHRSDRKLPGCSSDNEVALRSHTLPLILPARDALKEQRYSCKPRFRTLQTLCLAFILFCLKTSGLTGREKGRVCVTLLWS